MKKFNKFLITIATMASGATMASLWITHSDYWKITMPICLVCLTLNKVLEE
jgi:hypothetical protein